MTNAGDNCFFQLGEACQLYLAVRDDSHLSDVKERIESLWLIYKPYADKQFLEDARFQFHQRTWELYLGSVLIEHGLIPKKVSDEGPEFCVEVEGRKVWIEAIAPELGKGGDAVPPVPVGLKIATRVPEREIVLRLTNALNVKFEKYKRDAKKGIVSPRDCYVIAINGHHASGGRPEADPPYLFQAALGFGSIVATFDVETGAMGEWRYEWREQIFKKSGAAVPTNAFLSKEYSGISAVLYGPEDILNVPSEIGSEMFCLHNPLAAVRLPLGAFKLGREFWCNLETGKVEHKDWNLATS